MKLGTKLRKIVRETAIKKNTVALSNVMKRAAREGLSHIVINNGENSTFWSGVIYKGGWDKWANANGVSYVTDPTLKEAFNAKDNDVLLKW